MLISDHGDKTDAFNQFTIWYTSVSCTSILTWACKCIFFPFWETFENHLTHCL